MSTLAETNGSIKRAMVVFLLLAPLTLVSVFLFDELVAPTIPTNIIFLQTSRVLIVLMTTAIAVFIVRRTKKFFSGRLGIQSANFFEFVTIAILITIAVFSLLHVFNVDTNTLLISGGIISLTVGLVISTFVGDTLAGMLVLLLRMYRVGDTVLVNNIPSTVEEMGAFVTRFRNDAGGIVSIPNVAISQGGVVITRFSDLGGGSWNRLPYVVGDRVYTTYLNAEGVVVVLDSIHTQIKLDSGMELSFLNNSVLSGSIAVAKVGESSNKEIKRD